MSTYLAHIQSLTNYKYLLTWTAYFSWVALEYFSVVTKKIMAGGMINTIYASTVIKDFSAGSIHSGMLPTAGLGSLSFAIPNKPCMNSMPTFSISMIELTIRHNRSLANGEWAVPRVKQNGTKKRLTITGPKNGSSCMRIINIKKAPTKKTIKVIIVLRAGWKTILLLLLINSRCCWIIPLGASLGFVAAPASGSTADCWFAICGDWLGNGCVAGITCGDRSGIGCIIGIVCETGGCGFAFCWSLFIWLLYRTLQY